MKERLQIAPLSYTQGRGKLSVFFKHGGNGKRKNEIGLVED